MCTIRTYYLQYCGSYAPHRRRQTPDDGRRTMDAGPSTPYYKLTGELKKTVASIATSKCLILTLQLKVTVFKTNLITNRQKNLNKVDEIN